MELLLHGNILLVGEGDFSFAVSLVEKLPSNKYSSILATSLETEQSIKKHQYAARNIAQLQEKGVTVKLETDATQLHVNPSTSAEKFDCIVFNFPHAGGKSNHKKNRKLLNDFFASAVQVLKEQGQILMTLCKGQGGTPADRPMRAWHDSWQVVSMAANSSLILTKVLPFQAEKYTVYTSTGFRSLDKGFNTENALTHIFEMVEPVSIPTSVEKQRFTLGTHILSCPPYIYRKLTQIRCINTNKDHPVHGVYSRIVQQLETVVSSLEVYSLGMQPPLITVSKSDSVDESSVALNTCCIHSQLEKPENSTLDEIENISDLACEKMLTEVTSHNEEAVFVSDPFYCFDSKVLESIQILYVPVYQPCEISVNQSAISYHLAMAWPVSIGQNSVNDLKSLQESSFGAVNEATEKFIDIMNQVISKSNFKVEPVYLKDSESEPDQMKDFQSKPVHLKGSQSVLGDFVGSLHTADIIIRKNSNQPDANGKLVLGNKESKKIGACHVKVTGDSTCRQIQVNLTADLCKLACYVYSIEDERLLWSKDAKVLSQFAELKCEETPISQGLQNNVTKSEIAGFSVTQSNQTSTDHLTKDASMSACRFQSRNPVIKPQSLYPMTFVHDMSFWENPGVPFNVLEYCNIIRDVADDSVMDVELIDTYIDPESGKCSRCYRLTFQSVDKALSYNISWQLQSLIRLEVEKKIKIELR